MNSHRTSLTLGALVAVVVLSALLMGVAAPTAAANSITVTAPAGTATYDSNDILTVSWQVQTAVSGGYFCVYIKDSAGTVQQSKAVNASKGLTYTTTMALDVAFGQTYSVTVTYRPNRNTPATMSADSPGTFTIPEPPFPFQTLAYSPWGESVVKGQTHTFRFSVWHPDPNVVIQSGVIEFWDTRTRSLVTTRKITDIAPGAWKITSTWMDEPPLNATTIVCDIPVGDYLWMARVTADRASAGGGDGNISVTRR